MILSLRRVAFRSWELTICVPSTRGNPLKMDAGRDRAGNRAGRSLPYLGRDALSDASLRGRPYRFWADQRLRDRIAALHVDEVRSRKLRTDLLRHGTAPHLRVSQGCRFDRGARVADRSDQRRGGYHTTHYQVRAG